MMCGNTNLYSDETRVFSVENSLQIQPPTSTTLFLDPIITDDILILNVSPGFYFRSMSSYKIDVLYRRVLSSSR